MMKRIINWFSLLSVIFLMVGCSKEQERLELILDHDMLSVPTIEVENSDVLPYENKEEILGEILDSQKENGTLREKPAENSTEKKRRELLTNIKERGFFFDEKNSDWDTKQYNEAITNIGSNDVKNAADLEKAKQAYNLFIQYGKKAIKDFDNMDKNTKDIISQVENYNIFDPLDISNEKVLTQEDKYIDNLNVKIKNKDLYDKINSLTSKGLYIITDSSEKLKVVDRDTAIGYMIDLSKGNSRFIEESDIKTKLKIFLGTNTQLAFSVSLALDDINFKNEALEAAVFVYKLPQNEVEIPKEKNICKDSALRAINSLNPYNKKGYELRGGVIAMTKRSQEYALSLSAKERDQFYSIEKMTFVENNPNATLLNIGGTTLEPKYEYDKYTYDWWSGIPLYFSRVKNEVAATVLGGTMYAWGVEIPLSERAQLSRGHERSFITWFNREMTERDEQQILNNNIISKGDCDITSR